MVVSRSEPREGRASKSARGAISELLACAYLMDKGHYVYRCEAPNAPFDLVAYRGGRCLRIEVKTLTWQKAHWAPMFTVPQNAEWDLLVVVDPEAVFEFEADGFDARTANNRIRDHFGLAHQRELAPPKCGTVSGYQRHLRQDGPGSSCEPCAAASRRYNLAHRAQRAISAG